MKIIGIVTSPRYGKVSKNKLDKILDSEDILNSIYEIGYEGYVSNSECLLLSALWGANKERSDVELLYPGDLVPDYDGVILSTPVYFGDRSSNLYNFILNNDLKDKAVGIVSSGAKRNGGQETTNIYALYDCLCKGALITGNGPPTAQYGGTGWAGNKTSIVNDDFGIKTSYGTGSYVSKLSNLINMKSLNKKPNILFLDVSDEKSIELDDIINKNFSDCNVDFDDIESKNIKNCIGCSICPNGNLNDDYKCIIKDDMEIIREKLKWSDCVIYVTSGKSKNFQLFVERTRFIRRNHFELGQRVYSVFSIPMFDLNDIMPLRLMTNMLRQNMFGLPFYKSFMKYSNKPIDEYINTIKTYAKKSKIYREITGFSTSYTPVGYENAKINEKAYRD